MDQILQHVKLLENQHNIRVLYLCEFGSRVKGYGRETSDYDVVGIFVDVSLDAYWKREIFPENSDHITSSMDFKVPINRNDITDSSESVVHADFALWHLTKALRLLFTKKNFQLVLWCKSTVIYREVEEFTRFREFLLNQVRTTQIHPSAMYGWAKNACHHCSVQLLSHDKNLLRNALKSILVTWYQLLMMLLVIESNTVDTLDMFAEFHDKRNTVLKKWIEFIPADKLEELLEIRKLRESDENVDESSQKLIKELLDAAQNLLRRVDLIRFKNAGLTFDELWKEKVKGLIHAGLETPK